MKHAKHGKVLDFTMKTAHGRVQVLVYKGEEDFDAFVGVVMRLAGKSNQKSGGICTTTIGDIPVIAAPVWTEPGVWAHEMVHAGHEFKLATNGEALAEFVSKGVKTILAQIEAEAKTCRSRK